MSVEKGERSSDVERSRQLQILTLASRLGGWVTPELVADYCWPWLENSKQYARSALWKMDKRRRAGTKMVGKDLLLKRKLTAQQRAYVVTAKGVALALDPGLLGDEPIESIVCSNGTRWGRLYPGTDKPWQPPQDFGHDNFAARFMIEMINSAYSVQFDHECTLINEFELKKPDGLVWNSDRLYWVEVEWTAKTGDDMNKLADTIIDISGGGGPYSRLGETEAGKTDSRKADAVIVVLPFLARTTTGHIVNHDIRIQAAVKRRLRPFQEDCRWLFVREQEDGSFCPPTSCIVTAPEPLKW